MLCRDNNHRVVFLTERVEAKDEAFEGIYIKNFKAHREPSKDTHHYLNATEEAILKGQAVIRAITELKEEGFNPRVVINHGGMGLGLFIKDILPNSIQIGYFEWYFKPETTKHLVRDFNINTQLITGLRNMPILQELEGCDLCVTPTEWQKKQFPKAYSGKIEVIFDGIDDTFFKPSNSEEARSGELTLTNRDTKERYIIKSNEKIISYATRGMEPVRGFPEFMKMLPELLSTNNDLKVVIAGADRRAYSYDAPSHNGSWKEYMLSTIEDIKDSDNDKLTKIEGIEEDTAKELIERAKEFYKKDQEEISNRVKNLGLDNQLIELPGLTPGMLVTLGEQKILTINDFADLASDELTGTYDVVNGEKIKIKGYLEEFALTKQEADNLIMSARDIVYKN